ncbi:tyramine oxidase [Streptomyces sp. V2]|uniref:primary-amine oxidase n=1 Tax=Streptomyces TaxID=1883 RepID=UPI0006EB4A93|nr:MULTISPECIES: primary-amine oxidase [Streptomyces]PWG14114.1 tyramine oxidase [Streptomyces sp. V2]
MTDRDVTAAPPSHPIALLTAEEVHAMRAILEASGRLGPSTRFVSVIPEEPSKADLSAFAPGSTVDRVLRVQLLERSDGTSFEALVSVTRGIVVSFEQLDTRQAQLPILNEEFLTVQEILDGDSQWQQALARRGLTVETVLATSLSAGHFDFPGEEGHRIVRAFGLDQPHKHDLPWGQPIDGLVAYVDLTKREVRQVIDHAVVPVPTDPGNFHDPAYTGPHRTSLKPIEITQPEGASFSVNENFIQWQNWSLRIGYNVREGLTLHDISFFDKDRDRDRSVVHRASIAEMVVPYADPSPTRFWQNYFDGGEYLFGRYANPLELGCDCLGEIHYTDVVIADEIGRPKTIRNAICMHEEDFGVLWKHTDLLVGVRETRRQRRLVISFFSTVGNYDYGFYWYLYLDGTIGFEVKATGIVFPSGYQKERGAYATEIAPGLGAPFHQHLFSARLDMAVDGHRNAVDEVEVARFPISEENPYGNAFGRQATRLVSEQMAKRDANPALNREWHVINPEVTNHLGQPVAYALVPEGLPTLLADERSSIAARAAFARHHLWVTSHSDDERYPAGQLVNQHPGGAGLPAWTEADRSIDGEDIVLWHTFGLTHWPRPEDWPIMPVDSAGFTLKPVGFFDRNPTLDVPPSGGGGHCHSG